VSELAVLYRHLSDRSESELADLLTLRPDAAAPPRPQTLAELTKRLARPQSLFGAMSAIDATGVDILIALIALDDGSSRGRLASLVGEPSAVTRSEVDRVLAELKRRALVWSGGGSTLRLSPGVTDLLPTPLGLGTPLGRILPMLTVDQLRTLGRAIGAPPARGKAETIDRVAERLADPETVFNLLIGAPDGVAELLAKAMWRSPWVQLGYGDRTPGRYGGSDRELDVEDVRLGVVGVEELRALRVQFILRRVGWEPGQEQGGGVERSLHLGAGETRAAVVDRGTHQGEDGNERDGEHRDHAAFFIGPEASHGILRR